MGKSIKLKDGKTVRWPEDSDLKEILNQLSNDDIIGSSILSKDATTVDRIKFSLCAKILEYKHNKNLSQKDLAEKMNLDEPEISRILHYKIERYSIERLLTYAQLIYPKLTLEVLAA
jgi:predicted XRE-type DNA-binding protein